MQVNLISFQVLALSCVEFAVLYLKFWSSGNCRLLLLSYILQLEDNLY